MMRGFELQIFEGSNDLTTILINFFKKLTNNIFILFRLFYLNTDNFWPLILLKLIKFYKTINGSG